MNRVDSRAVVLMNVAHMTVNETLTGRIADKGFPSDCDWEIADPMFRDWVRILRKLDTDGCST